MVPTRAAAPAVPLAGGVILGLTLAVLARYVHILAEQFGASPDPSIYHDFRTPDMSSAQQSSTLEPDTGTLTSRLVGPSAAASIKRPVDSG
jgi:hypothetical protein